MATNTFERPHAFNYQLQRGMIGAAAGFLAIVVWAIGCDDLPSIRADCCS